MNRARRTIRRVGATAGTVLCLAVWHPAHVEPQAADLVAQAGQALDAGRVDEAIAMFEQAVAADPNDPAALAWLGSAQVRKAREACMFAAAGWVKKGFTTMDQAVAPLAIVRHDLHGGADRRIEAGDARVFGEPVFVPHPGRREEHRGWVLAQGYDAGRDETFLEIRDAGTLEFQARVWTGQHFPLGFHGNFYAA